MSRYWRRTLHLPATHAIVENAKGLLPLHRKNNQDQPWLNQEIGQHQADVVFQQQLRRADRALVGSRKKFCELLQQLTFTLGANKTLDWFAIFKHNQSWNAHHAETHCDVTVIIHI